MNKRKILLLAALLAIVAILGVGGTLAYFTADESVTNTFTVGNVKIELTEPNWTASGSEDAPEVYPGEALKKDPTVKNVGANPCFVRVKVEGLDCLKTEGDGEEMLIHVRTNYVADALGADWVLYEDGYYYYKHVLAADETTATPVFDSIVIPTALENGNGTTKYNIEVTAYAVQAQGAKPSFAAVQEMTVAEIADWFETCAPEEWAD